MALPTGTFQDFWRRQVECNVVADRSLAREPCLDCVELRKLLPHSTHSPAATNDSAT